MDHFQAIADLSQELHHKIRQMREILHETRAAGLRLRGVDWFAWATAGGSSVVLQTAETGVAEVFITPTDAWILTNRIEFERLAQEEVLCTYQFFAAPIWDVGALDRFVERLVGAGAGILSDRPTSGEGRLPSALLRARWTLLPTELERYRLVGHLAAEAMGETLKAAHPAMTELALAGAGAQALYARGLEPALVLCAGSQRLPHHRHPLPRQSALGDQAMLVFCARGFGLYANLTRFVFLGPVPESTRQAHASLREIEAAVLASSLSGATLHHCFEVLKKAYARAGHAEALEQHHQGGITGYLSRESLATPSCSSVLTPPMALAWNPSLPGAKIEDTFLLTSDNRLENLTFDPRWPSTTVGGRRRPLPLEI